jgi:hypothetical protein
MTCRRALPATYGGLTYRSLFLLSPCCERLPSDGRTKAYRRSTTALTSRFESEPDPGEGDVGISRTPAMKMLAFSRGALDDGAVSMEVDQLTAADVPHEAGTAEVHERTLVMTTEQGFCIPT